MSQSSLLAATDAAVDPGRRRARIAWFGAVALGRAATWLLYGAALAAWLVLGYWNHPAWIVRKNVERYAYAGTIDVLHLVYGAGPDAVPQLLASLAELSPQERACALRTLAAADGSTLGPSSPPPAWYEWTWRRAALAAVGLSPRSPDVEEEPHAGC